jgi:Cu2+-exporting ATPase
MTCTLCDLPTPDPPATAEDVEGAFCCRGCLEVARTLEDPGAADAAAARDRLSDETAAAGESASTFLSVSGMHCATCEAFLESRATDQDGVFTASASYPTGSMKVTYDPGAVDPADLPDLVGGAGYQVDEDGGAHDDGSESVGRLLVGGFFGMMTMVWYVLFLYPAYLGVSPDTLLLDLSGVAGQYLLWNLWLMTTVVVGYTGYPLLRGAYVSLRAGQPNMDLLVALAATTAYLYSTATVVLGGSEVYFDVATVIVLAVTVGNHYEDRVRRRAAGALTDLTEQRVESARRRTGDAVETVPVEALDPGDEVVVGTDERVPADGTVVEGTGAVDESLVTGESLPVRKEPGDAALGGAPVVEGGLVVAVGEDVTSALDRVTDLLWEVRSATPGAQRLADRIAAVFVPFVVVLAAATVGWHLFAGAPLAAAVLTGLAVLVVSCPCALGLATPLAVAAGLRRALAAGTVVTDASTFERAPDVETVAFDKTGTLTTGEMTVTDVRGPEETLSRAAAVEQFADHPVAAAITDAADAPDTAVEGFERHPGRGVTATVDGAPVAVGSAALFAQRDWTVPESLADAAGAARDRGAVPALVGWDGRARGLVTAGDQPREGWADAVAALDAREVVVITGDQGEAAATFEDHPAVDRVFAGVPPEAKAETVERLRADGPVAMVGDGSNDAPALAAADIGVSLERGTRLAADAADAVVATDDLDAVPGLFDLVDRTNRRIRENLAWAFCYNAVAVPLAVAGALNPLFAAVAMAASSLLVVGNSARSLGG